MKIGLVDIDSHNFPNLPLMKLSAYHKSKGDGVEFVNYFKSYDIVYKSKVFTYTPDESHFISAKKIIFGGTGYKLYDVKLSENIEHICPDYSLYNYPYAVGFLTRGCPNHCSFCIVPKKEGNIKPNADIDEFLDNRKVAILLDNNVLASNFGLKQIEKMVDLRLKIDFNQGLDARYIANNPDIAKLLSRLKWFKYLRMSCDTLGQMKYVEKATNLLRKYGCTPKDYFVYVIVYPDINEALTIVNFLKKLGLKPYAQPFRDFENKKIKPTIIQKRFRRWCNNYPIFNTVDWKDYGINRAQKEFARWVNVRNIFNKIDYQNYKARSQYFREKKGKFF